MTLNEYQEQAMTTCLPSANNFSYMALNLVGEVGEFASKVAKQIRKEQFAIGKVDMNELEIIAGERFDLDFEEEHAIYMKVDEELAKEAGDILWQLSGICSVMGWSLEEIAQMNLNKLQARKNAGTIDGSGDGNTAAEGRK